MITPSYCHSRDGLDRLAARLPFRDRCAQDDWVTSAHEAGHAVGCLVFHVPFVRIELCSDADGVDGRILGASAFPTVESRLVFLLNGYAAEQELARGFVDPSVSWRCAGSDLESARALVYDDYRAIREAQKRAQTLARNHRAALLAIALELFHRITVSYSTCQQLYLW